MNNGYIVQQRRWVVIKRRCQSDCVVAALFDWNQYPQPKLWLQHSPYSVLVQDTASLHWRMQQGARYKHQCCRPVSCAQFWAWRHRRTRTDQLAHISCIRFLKKMEGYVKCIREHEIKYWSFFTIFSENYNNIIVMYIDIPQIHFQL
jgi:hypothetical protein